MFDESGVPQKRLFIIISLLGSPNGAEILVDNFRLYTAQPSRETIGHVTSAGYSLVTSLDSGVGFVTLPGLMEAIRGCYTGGIPHLLVLARGASLQYFLVKICVL